MQLAQLAFSEFPKRPNKWLLLPSDFQDINLLVGRNASGKSRVLSVIYSLALSICGKRHPLTDGVFHAVWRDGEKEYVYDFEIDQRQVKTELLKVDGSVKLKRGSTGRGAIWLEKDQRNLNFMAPTDRLAVVMRRDPFQHPFIEPLYFWGLRARHYQFGSSLGRDQLIVPLKDETTDLKSQAPLKTSSGRTEDSEAYNPVHIVQAFQQGQKRWGSKFIKSILSDINGFGYSCKAIGLASLDTANVKFSGPVAPMTPPTIIFVQERDLSVRTTQMTMSQGMWRALALSIYVQYSIFSGVRPCLLIDDIGEGLDFERSTSVINVLIKHAKAARIQLIMSSNDRFVMSKIPLKYWSVIERKKQVVKILNAKNSRARFEEFRFVGLDNFYFFSNKLYKK